MQKLDKKRPYLYGSPKISFVTDNLSGSSALVVLYEDNAYYTLNGQNPLQTGKWPELSKMQVLEPDGKYYGSDQGGYNRAQAMAQSMLVRYVQCPKCNPRRKARKAKAAQ